MLRLILFGVGLYLMLKRNTQPVSPITLAPGAPVPDAPAGWVWVPLMSGAKILMRADDPLRASID